MVYYGIPRLKAFLKLDTLASFKLNSGSLTMVPVITMGDSRVDFYDGAKLAGFCQVSGIEVSRDRLQIKLKDICEGRYTDKNGKAFTFTALNGSWQKAIGQLDCEGGVKVQNANFNLGSDTLRYIQKDGELRIDGAIKGKFLGGDLEATKLRYRVGTGAFEVGPISWAGTLQDKDAAPTKTLWRFKGDSGASTDGDVVTYKMGSATDGEIIVKADTIVSNRKTGVIVATGHVKYFGKDANMTCPKATVYRKEKRVVLQDGVSMLVKAQDDTTLQEVEIEPLRPVVPESISAARPPAPTDEEKKLDNQVIEPGNRRKYPVKVLAQTIEYWYQKGNRRARINGSPQARQELPGGRWRQIWCDFALYNGETDRLRMDSTGGKLGTRMRSSRGDDLRTAWFDVSTKEGDDSWKSGTIQGEFIEDDSEIESPPPPGTGSPPPMVK